MNDSDLSSKIELLRKRWQKCVKKKRKPKKAEEERLKAIMAKRKKRLRKLQGKKPRKNVMHKYKRTPI